MQYRRDIGWRAPGRRWRRTPPPASTSSRATAPSREMRHAVERTHGAEVVRGVGSFGGAFSAKAIAAMDDPVLVASTDGVGTKVELAARLGRVRGLGHDIVNHCVGDVFVQSARPLFFLDYVAASKLDADLVAEMVGGMAEACDAAGCTLLGGETAEMPGVYTAWLVRHRRHPRRRRRARRAAAPPRRRRRRRADRRGVERPAHQRLLAAAQAVRLDPDGRHARRDSTARSATPCSSRTATTCRCSKRPSPPAPSRRSPTSPAAAFLENVPRVLPGDVDAVDPPRVVAACRRCSELVRELATALDDQRAAPHAEHGHRHGRGLRTRRRRGSCSRRSPRRPG